MHASTMTRTHAIIMPNLRPTQLEQTPLSVSHLGYESPHPAFTYHTAQGQLCPYLHNSTSHSSTWLEPLSRFFAYFPSDYSSPL
jgi:hypothetical protein